jgi:histidine kinase
MLGRLLLARTTWKRWAYLVVGGALLLPYWMVSSLVVSFLQIRVDDDVLVRGALMLLLPVPVVFATGLVPAVRVLEATAVTELVGESPAGLGDRRVGPAADWRTRVRTACWFCLHLHAGVFVSALSLLVPPATLALASLPFLAWGNEAGGPFAALHAWPWLGPAAGVLLLAALLALIVLAGTLADRLSATFLRPSSAERVAALERRATRLAERNRLARELHDSVGHALSVVTLQAAAAGRVLDSDPGFARQALSAIEESARGALEDLDYVLGLLREETRGTAPQPTLDELDGLLDKTRLAGITLDAQLDGGLDQVPAAVSREAYRIVQEGLTNALRHAGKVPVRLVIRVDGDRLRLALSNPMPGPDQRARRRLGGRGLSGIH